MINIFIYVSLSAGYRRAVALAVTVEGTLRTRTAEVAPPPSPPTQLFTPPRVHRLPAFPSHTLPLSSPPWVRRNLSVTLGNL